MTILVRDVPYVRVVAPVGQRESAQSAFVAVTTNNGLGPYSVRLANFRVLEQSSG